jgi:predicted nucleotidyltransferase
MNPLHLNHNPAPSGREACQANDVTANKPDSIIADLAAELKQRLGGHLRGLWLFGSRARGDARTHSDYDLLILVDESSAELRERILDLQVEMLDRHDALVATLLRTEDEWQRSQTYPLARNIAREAIRL